MAFFRYETWKICQDVLFRHFNCSFILQYLSVNIQYTTPASLSKCRKCQFQTLPISHWILYVVLGLALKLRVSPLTVNFGLSDPEETIDGLLFAHEGAVIWT